MFYILLTHYLKILIYSNLYLYSLSFVLLWPLYSALSPLLLGNLLGTRGSVFITNFFILLSLSVVLLFLKIMLVNGGNFYFVEFYKWIDFDFFRVTWSFFFDSVTIFMLLIIFFISFLVHLYSVGYMWGDPHLVRFMGYLSLFTFFMVFLVTSDDLVQFFLGWEGVGICSYLLINFWFLRLQANKAAIKAVLVNKISDFALVFGIVLIFFCFKTTSLQVLSLFFSDFYLLSKFNFVFYILGYKFYLLNVVAFFFFLGAMGKSAQLGLHTWLPDAMEGPTPVSALLHAATMVTAGVYLLLRCSFLFVYTPKVLFFVAVVGSFTALFGSAVALFQYDLKKIIAYSTCSQLGYMFLACGLGNFFSSFYHLVNHAFFKALLFLAAGSVIHALDNEQDIRRMGNFVFLKMPVTFAAFLIGSLALMGFSFSGGFYSKDSIMESTFYNLGFFGYFFLLVAFLAALITCLYSIRLLGFVFFSNVKNLSFYRYLYIGEGNFFIMIPLILLLMFSIFFGYFFFDVFLGMGSQIFYANFYVNYNSFVLFDLEFLPEWFKLFLFLFFGFLVFFFDSNFFYFKDSVTKFGNSGNFLKYNKLYGSYLSYYYYLNNTMNLTINSYSKEKVIYYFSFVELFSTLIPYRLYRPFVKFLFYFILKFEFFFNQKFFFDRLYNFFINKRQLDSVFVTVFQVTDKGIFEFFGPHGIILAIRFIFKRMYGTFFWTKGFIFNFLDFFISIFFVFILVSLVF